MRNSAFWNPLEMEHLSINYKKEKYSVIYDYILNYLFIENSKYNTICYKQIEFPKEITLKELALTEIKRKVEQ